MKRTPSLDVPGVASVLVAVLMLGACGGSVGGSVGGSGGGAAKVDGGNGGSSGSTLDASAPDVAIRSEAGAAHVDASSDLASVDLAEILDRSTAGVDTGVMSPADSGSGADGSTGSSVIWANWTTAQVGNPDGLVTGTLNLGAVTVNLTYSGEVFNTTQLNGTGMDYYTPATTYTTANGTYVDGIRISGRVLVRPGQEIGLGSFRFQLYI